MPLNSSVGVELKTVKRRSGPKTAGGRSSSALKTLKPAVPAAIAIASEATAMDVSFACFLRMRRENRMLDQSAMFAPIREADQHRYPKIYHDLVPVPDKSRNCSSTNSRDAHVQRGVKQKSIGIDPIRRTQLSVAPVSRWTSRMN